MIHLPDPPLVGADVRPHCFVLDGTSSTLVLPWVCVEMPRPEAVALGAGLILRLLEGEDLMRLVTHLATDCEDPLTHLWTEIQEHALDGGRFLYNETTDGSWVRLEYVVPN